MFHSTNIIFYLTTKKKRSKGLVQGPDVQKTFHLSSHTPEKFNSLSRILINNIYKVLSYNTYLKMKIPL